MEKLQQIEKLAEQMFNAPSPADREAATLALNGFTTNASCIGDCRDILQHSRSQFALLMATKSLLHLTTRFWNKFTPDQTAELSSYLVTFLGTRCSEVPPFVVKSATQVLARVHKFGFNSHPQHRDLCSNLDNFFNASLTHFLTGLQILSDIVEEMTRVSGYNKNPSRCFKLPDFMLCSGQTNSEHRKVVLTVLDTLRTYLTACCT
jgi:hypothetical protein